MLKAGWAMAGHDEVDEDELAEEHEQHEEDPRGRVQRVLPRVHDVHPALHRDALEDREAGGAWDGGAVPCDVGARQKMEQHWFPRPGAPGNVSLSSPGWHPNKHTGCANILQNTVCRTQYAYCVLQRGAPHPVPTRLSVCV